jgi:hypothetical protein
MTGVTSLVVMQSWDEGYGWASDRAARESDDLLIANRPRVRDRVTTRWRSRRLDLALSAGTPAETAAALALRARQLTDLSNRRALATALRRIVRQAQEDAGPSYPRIIPARSRVAAASDELSRLADTLSEPGPVAARGVAQTRILLTDGTGPLYNPGSAASVRASAASAAENLAPRSS